MRANIHEPLHTQSSPDIGVPEGGDCLERTVLIVCSQLLREALKQILGGANIKFAGGARTVSESLALLDQGVAADLAIAVLPGDGSAAEAISSIAMARVRFPGTRWLLLLDSVSPTSLRLAVAAGVDGVLQHDITARALRHATEFLLLGQTLLPAGLAELDLAFKAPAPPLPNEHEDYSIRTAAPDSHPVSMQLVQLSSRERQILDCVARGYSNKLIARELEIADATVKVHVKALLRKLRVSNRTQAAVFAVHHPEQSGLRPVASEGGVDTGPQQADTGNAINGYGSDARAVMARGEPQLEPDRRSAVSVRSLHLGPRETTCLLPQPVHDINRV